MLAAPRAIELVKITYKFNRARHARASNSSGKNGWLENAGYLFGLKKMSDKFSTHKTTSFSHPSNFPLRAKGVPRRIGG